MSTSVDAKTDISPPFQGHYCLVVEDNTFALDIMNIFLQREGFHVDCAENGQAALKKYLADPGKYSIIFMDLQMPVMGGYEATQKIRNSGCENAAALPIVAMSGDPLNNLHELGFDRHLKKPFELHAVSSILQELLTDISEGK